MRRVVSPWVWILLLAVSASAGDSSTAPRYLGTWAYADGEAGHARLSSAVEQVVSEFGPLLRGVARRRLVESSLMPEHMRVVPGAEGVSLHFESDPDASGPAELERDALVRRQQSFEGTREIRATLSPDATRLTMRVTTRSSLLPSPFDYEIAFERADGAAPLARLAPDS